MRAPTWDGRRRAPDVDPPLLEGTFPTSDWAGHWTRATKNETQVREFTITADGVTLGDTIDSRPSNAIG